jgi:hypothetical protein
LIIHIFGINVWNIVHIFAKHLHNTFRHLRTDDVFSTFSLNKIVRPPTFQEILEINFQFYIVSISHGKCRDRKWSGQLTSRVKITGSTSFVYFIFATTTFYYTIFFQQPEMIKIINFKSRRVSLILLWKQDRMQANSRQIFTKNYQQLRNASPALKL